MSQKNSIHNTLLPTSVTGLHLGFDLHADAWPWDAVPVSCVSCLASLGVIVTSCAEEPDFFCSPAFFESLRTIRPLPDRLDAWHVSYQTLGLCVRITCDIPPDQPVRISLASVPVCTD